MTDGDMISNDARPFSKKEAALYLGLKIRSLEYRMAARVIPYEKLGKKVVFRLSDLDAYRAKVRIRSKDAPHAPNYAATVSPPVMTSPQRLNTIQPNDARELLRELESGVTEARRLTREPAHLVLIRFGNYTKEEADRLLSDHEARELSALERMGTHQPARAATQGDWSFAVALAYIDFLGRFENWSSCGADTATPIRLRSPFDAFTVYPERMLSCLKIIPETVFSHVLRETNEYFHGQYPNELIPLKEALRQSPESINRAPYSFAGPTTESAFEKLLVQNFCAWDVYSILYGQAVSYSALAKIRLLTRPGKTT